MGWFEKRCFCLKRPDNREMNDRQTTRRILGGCYWFSNMLYAKQNPCRLKKPAGVTKVHIYYTLQKDPLFFQENLIDPVSADGDKTRGKYGLYKLLLILSGKDPGLFPDIHATPSQL